MFSWAALETRFSQYLLLERSLSPNSKAAYTNDLRKLKAWSELFHNSKTPEKFNAKDLQNFSSWVAEVGASAGTQARVLAGIRSFYKFLLLEDLIQTNPAELLEGPKLQRKLPVFL